MKTIILLTIFLLVIEICQTMKEVNFIRLAACPQIKNQTAVFKNVVFTKNKRGKTVAMRFEVEFKKEVKRLMIMVSVRKCDSENLDSCEYYMRDLKVNNACDIIGKENQLWSKVLANSNFPRSCPIVPGTYRLNDTKLETDKHQLAVITVPIALWKIRFYTYDSGNNNVLVSCSDLDLKVYTARRNS